MLIRTHELAKTYVMGTVEVRALRGVDLDIAQGEFMSIIGRSGSGKSTLMHLLGCLDRPTGGRYRLEGTAIETMDDTQLSRIRNERIGFVFQSFNLIAQHSVVENVELPLVYLGKDKIERRERAVQLLERVGLATKTENKPTELSGGELQRAAIARALVADPLLLLADEPTGNLDSRTGEEIMGLFRELHAQGSTIIMVTHDTDVACQADRVIEMQDGKIIRDSSGELRNVVDGF